MKTFVRLIRRYILVMAGISFLLFALAVTFFVWLGVHFGLQWQREFSYSYSEIADHLQRDADGHVAFDQDSADQWLKGYAWAMILDESGQVIWQYQLPQELDRAYTVSEVASFTKWYLADYPVFCQIRDYGLLVLAMPQGSIWKYNFWTYPELIEGILYRGGTVMLGIVVLILMLCMFFSWKSTRSLKVVADGLDSLAEGRTVELPTKGFAGELAEKLNQTSAQLRYRNEIIRRRDNARTNWIAGVSHDIRTPLALILGWAEQLQRETQLPEETRQKAQKIQAQSEKIKALVEDLNLTSKLQYGAQPLRRQWVHTGPILRKMVADFCNGPLANSCEVELAVQPEAETAELQVDTALLARALDNLLGNSVRHNPVPVHCCVEAGIESKMLCLTVTDDGEGYPQEVLQVLQSGNAGENAPHILGIHVVEQILQAHGGQVFFSQNLPHGAKTVLQLPLS